jgi:hypothetical protein
MRAWVDLTVAIHLHSENRPERFRSAEADLGKALRLRPETADAHVALGLLRLQTNRADQGIAECERGLAIDRNHPHAHALIGVGKILPAAPTRPRRMSSRRCGSVRTTAALECG